MHATVLAKVVRCKSVLKRSIYERETPLLVLTYSARVAINGEEFKNAFFDISYNFLFRQFLVRIQIFFLEMIEIEKVRNFCK